MAFEKEQAKIMRTTPRREILVTGFDESATPYELSLALVEAKECSCADVRLGPIRSTRDGLYSVWARCPVIATIKIAEKEKLKIGR